MKAELKIPLNMQPKNPMPNALDALQLIYAFVYNIELLVECI